MALHDVDKRSDKRIEPVPNAPDKLPADVRMAHGTFSISLTSEGSETSAKLVFKDGKFEIYRSDGTKLASLTEARAADGEAAVDIAKPGSGL